MRDAITLFTYEAYWRAWGLFDDELEERLREAARDAGAVPRFWSGRIVFARVNPTPQWLEIYLQEQAGLVCLRLSPEARVDRLLMRRLAAIDIHKPVEVEIYDADANGRPIGDVYGFVSQGHWLVGDPYLQVDLPDLDHPPELDLDHEALERMLRNAENAFDLGWHMRLCRTLSTRWLEGAASGLSIPRVPLKREFENAEDNTCDDFSRWVEETFGFNQDISPAGATRPRH